jgi:hypothetical protein
MFLLLPFYLPSKAQYYTTEEEDTKRMGVGGVLYGWADVIHSDGGEEDLKKRNVKCDTLVFLVMA